MGYVAAMDSQPQELECPNCRLLQKRVADLTAKVIELGNQVKQLTNMLEAKTRQTKRSAAPQRVRKSRKKPESEHLKPGRKEGHASDSKPVPDKIDRVVEIPEIPCPDCQCRLTDVEIHRQYQSDLPPVIPIVTEFRVPVGTCPCCKKRVQATHPEQNSLALGAANHTLGPNAIATAAELKYSFGMPFRKISDFFQSAFGLSFCAGGIVRATQVAAQKSSGLILVLKLQIASSTVVHADETGWWLKGLSRYLHCFCTQDTIVYQVGDRSNETALEILGPHFGGTVICDGYAGYDVFHTARCNSHPLHRIHEMIETKIGDKKTLTVISELLSSGISLSKNRDSMDSIEYANKIWDHQNLFHAWIETNTKHASEPISRLARHLRDYESEFTKHLRDREIPPTNNYAEQSLRGAVLLRKIGCCNRSEKGVETFEIMKSLFATFAKRGRNFKDWLRERLMGPEQKYVPPILLPVGSTAKILLN